MGAESRIPFGELFAPYVAIGYWHSYGPFASLPHPQSLVDPTWEPRRRRKVVKYLKSGLTWRLYMGFSTCRFCCAANGATDLTDGVWVWPEGLAHYIEKHAVRLPDEFVAHADRNRFQIRGTLHSELQPANWRSFWEDWCARHARFEFEPNCGWCNNPHQWGSPTYPS